jgi:hypothetical protein
MPTKNSTRQDDLGRAGWHPSNSLPETIPTRPARHKSIGATAIHLLLLAVLLGGLMSAGSGSALASNNPALALTQLSPAVGGGCNNNEGSCEENSHNTGGCDDNSGTCSENSGNTGNCIDDTGGCQEQTNDTTGCAENKETCSESSNRVGGCKENTGTCSENSHDTSGCQENTGTCHEGSNSSSITCDNDGNTTCSESKEDSGGGCNNNEGGCYENSNNTSGCNDNSGTCSENSGNAGNCIDDTGGCIENSDNVIDSGDTTDNSGRETNNNYYYSTVNNTYPVSPTSQGSSASEALISKRDFSAHFFAADGKKLKLLLVRINGKLVKQLKGRSITSNIDFTGFPCTTSRQVVVLTGMLVNGRRISETRHYNICQ